MELRETVAECLIFLDSVGEKNWRTRMESYLETVARHGGIESPAIVLSWFGGMGSFNDLLIMDANGHTVPPGKESELNRQLNEIKDNIYNIALIRK